MPRALRSGRIADPVHGYVNFTGVERAILNHPVAQRLRYVAQNGLAHLVFPEVRSSRFSHSLGAMHLTSGFLAACLRNADPDTLQQVGDAIRLSVERVAGEVGDPERAAAELITDATLAAHHYCRPTHASSVVLAEQGLRLAALFHDLGHLPFSHDFEHALDFFWRGLPDEQKNASPLKRLLQQGEGQTKIHERLGHAASLLLLRDLFDDLRTETEGEAARICFEFARGILTSTAPRRPSPQDAATYWLHTLMDGEIDSDRCDYILRDGRNYGFEFAQYDLRRLLDNLVVAREGEGFTLAIKPAGLSAVESFLIARVRSYQYGVRHHKVAQIGAALGHAIADILATPPETVSAFIDDIGVIADAADPNASRDQLRDAFERFAGYDDIWWTGLMRERARTRGDEWMKLVCYRQAGPRSLWKRPGDFPIPLRPWNERLPDPDDPDAQVAWFDAVVGLQQDGVLVVRHTFSPYRTDQSGASLVRERQVDGRLRPVSDLLPLVRALSGAWMDDLQVHAVARSDSPLAGQPRMVIDRLVPPDMPDRREETQ